MNKVIKNKVIKNSILILLKFFFKKKAKKNFVQTRGINAFLKATDNTLMKIDKLKVRLLEQKIHKE